MHVFDKYIICMAKSGDIKIFENILNSICTKNVNMTN